VIEQCWHSNPAVRPTFSHTIATLLKLAKSRSINVDIVETVNVSTPIAKSGKPINWHNALELISAASSINLSSGETSSPIDSLSTVSSHKSTSTSSLSSSPQPKRRIDKNKDTKKEKKEKRKKEKKPKSDRNETKNDAKKVKKERKKLVNQEK